MDDDTIVRKAFSENRILISNNKDFGEKIYRERFRHNGLVLLQLDDECSAGKIEAVRRLLEHYSDRLTGNFVVATKTTVRFAYKK